MSTATTHPRLSKLLALANAGVGGERTQAARALERELKKAGLTLEDLEAQQVDAETDFERFPYCLKSHEGKLVRQIVCAVIGLSVYEGRGNPYSAKRQRSTYFKLTKAEAAECRFLVNAHLTGLKKTLETATVAYIHANRIFPEDGPATKPGEVDRERLEKIMAMMEGAERTTVVSPARHLGAGL